MQTFHYISKSLTIHLIVFSLFPGLVSKWTASALFVDSSISKNSLEKLNVRMSPCGIVVNCKFHRTFPFSTPIQMNWPNFPFIRNPWILSFYIFSSRIQNTSPGSFAEYITWYHWISCWVFEWFDLVYPLWRPNIWHWSFDLRVPLFVDTENTQDALRIVLKCHPKRRE